MSTELGAPQIELVGAGPKVNRGNRYAEHHVAQHCGGFYGGDGDFNGSYNVDRLASKGCRDTRIRATDGFVLRTMPRKFRWWRQTKGVRPKVPGKRQQVTRQMNAVRRATETFRPILAGVVICLISTKRSGDVQSRRHYAAEIILCLGSAVDCSFASHTLTSL